MNKMTKEEFVKKMMEEQEKRNTKRTIKKEVFTESKERNISEKTKILKKVVPVSKNIKQNDYKNQILMPMIKKFNTLIKPPFPRNHEEYIYNEQDLNFVLTQINNPYLKIKNIPNWGSCYGKELYLSEK